MIGAKEKAESPTLGLALNIQQSCSGEETKTNDATDNKRLHRIANKAGSR